MNNETNGDAIVFTDGSCISNPGPGGWAALIVVGESEHVVSGYEPTITTNIRMEFLAAIRALEFLPPGSRVTLHSDNELLVRGMNEWLAGWKARGWRRADKKPVLNQDLWMRLDALNAERSVIWVWVKAHAGHEHNERVDGLANEEAGKAAAELGWTEASRFGFSPLSA